MAALASPHTAELQTAAKAELRAAATASMPLAALLHSSMIRVAEASAPMVQAAPTIPAKQAEASALWRIGGAVSNAGCSGDGMDAYAGSANGAAFGGDGIYAQASVSGGSQGSGRNYAGYFDGDVHIAGALSKTGGSFQIDHPLDPANKYPYHSFVESPEMENIYDGNVVTDASGTAIVSMPAWFEALNADFAISSPALASRRAPGSLPKSRTACLSSRPTGRTSRFPGR